MHTMQVHERGAHPGDHEDAVVKVSTKGQRGLRIFGQIPDGTPNVHGIDDIRQSRLLTINPNLQLLLTFLYFFGVLIC